MKRLALILPAVGLVFFSTRAVSGSVPTHTLLWNDFQTMAMVDSIAVLGGSEGVMSARFDQVTRQFQPVGYACIPGPIVKLKRFDSIIVAQSAAGALSFFRTSSLPQLVGLGTSTPKVDYLDFAVIDRSLYLARGFDGLTQYRMTDYSTSAPIDSSLDAIHPISLEVGSDRLFAVDDLSGVFVYRGTSDSLGAPASYLALSSPARAMTLRNDTAYIGDSSPSILKAVLHHDSLKIVDTLPVWFSLSRLQIIDTFLVGTAGDGQGFDVISLSGRHNVIWRDSGSIPSGAISFDNGGAALLAVPDRNAGLHLYNLDKIETDLLQPRPAYPFAGTITGLTTFNGAFIVARRNQPLLSYRVDAQGAPLNPESVLPGVDGADAVVSATDRLLAFYPDQHMLAVIKEIGGRYELDKSLTDLPNMIDRVCISDNRLDTLRALFLLGDRFIDLYSVSDRWQITLRVRMFLPEQPRDIALFDRLIVVGSATRLFVYGISPDFWINHLSTVELTASPGDPNQLIQLVPPPDWTWYPLLVVCSRSVRAYGLYNPSNPIMSDSLFTPYGLSAAARVGDILYVTSEDRGLLKLQTSFPTSIGILDSISVTGHLIAAAGDIVAVASDHAGYLFDWRTPLSIDTDRVNLLPELTVLHQNYPNPFNPTTTIAYDLSSPDRVRLVVYNLLGQTVGELIDARQTPGHHVIDFDASRLSSGVYVYRLTAGSQSQTRKMVLVK